MWLEDTGVVCFSEGKGRGLEVLGDSRWDKITNQHWMSAQALKHSAHSYISSRIYDLVLKAILRYGEYDNG